MNKTALQAAIEWRLQKLAAPANLDPSLQGIRKQLGATYRTEDAPDVTRKTIRLTPRQDPIQAAPKEIPQFPNLTTAVDATKARTGGDVGRRSVKGLGWAIKKGQQPLLAQELARYGKLISHV